MEDVENYVEMEDGTLFRVQELKLEESPSPISKKQAMKCNLMPLIKFKF